MEKSTKEEIAIATAKLMIEFPHRVVEYKQGKTGILGLFVGEAMKKLHGKADPKELNAFVKEVLDKTTVCEHKQFEARVDVTRLSEVDGGPITGYTTDISVCCAECKTPFEFIGVPNGYSPEIPMASADFLKLSAPIRPTTGNIATKLSYQVKPKKVEHKNIN